MAMKASVGTSHFRDYRSSGAHYVDKTAFLKDFLVDPPEATLFTRPRRFGKTMTLSMMAEFFDMRNRDAREDLFEGLSVTGDKALCDKWKHQYPVVFLSFKDIERKTFEGAYEELRSLFRSVCAAYPYLRTSEKVLEEDRDDLVAIKKGRTDEATWARSLFILTRALRSHHGKQAIVLIDEYDVPIAKAHEHGYYNDMLLFMRRVFSLGLKDNANLRFGVLTGCLRIVKESIFTGFNNFSCYDISQTEYDDVFGFTSDEVDDLLAAAGLPDRKEEFREWYNGYRFGNRGDMYCPWDIMKRIVALRTNSKTEPQCYWLHSSGNGVIGDFVRQMKPDVMEKMFALLGGGCVKAPVSSGLNYSELGYKAPGQDAAVLSSDAKESNFWSLLYHTGYLTKASEERAKAAGVFPSSDETALVVPNREIALIYVKELLPFIGELLSKADADALVRALWSMDGDALKRELEKMLPHVGETSRVESAYTGILFGILYSRHRNTELDRQGGAGRFDLLVRDEGKRAALVIEVKRTTNPSELPGLPKDALDQIARMEYDAEVDREKHPTVIHWGIAFCGHRCAVDARDASDPDDAPRPGF